MIMMFRASSLEKELDSPVTQFSTASGEDSDNTSKSKVGIPPLRVTVLSEFRDLFRDNISIECLLLWFAEFCCFGGMMLLVDVVNISIDSNVTYGIQVDKASLISAPILDSISFFLILL